VTDEVCKRCGSTELAAVESMPSNAPAPAPTPSSAVWFLKTLVISFLLAVGIEFLSLLPILPLIGFGPSHGEPTDSLGRIVFILNLPTVLVTWLLDKFSAEWGYVFYTPITQVIFWTVLLIYLKHKIRSRRTYP
jgi:hypothetical protein